MRKVNAGGLVFRVEGSRLVPAIFGWVMGGFVRRGLLSALMLRFGWKGGQASKFT